MSHTEAINQRFYDRLYRRKNLFFQLIHPLISFDQQSKSKDNYQLIRPLVQKARKNGKNLRVLDYGFGHGTFLLKFPRWVDLYGCDISTEAVQNFPRVAQSFGRKAVTFHPEEWDQLPEELSFDIICLSHILEHVEDDLSLLKLLANRLAPHGHILINVPINEFWPDPKHIREYDKTSLRNAMLMANLEIVHLQETAHTVAFFMRHEMLNKARGLKKIALRVLRLVLAVLPQSWNNLIDRTLSKKYQAYHLLALGSKES